TLSNPKYFDVLVSGISDGTANVCIANSIVVSGSTVQYWTGSSWASATNISVSGTTICGNIPVSTLTGTNIIIGLPPTGGGHGGSTPGFPPSFTTGFTPDQDPLTIDGSGFKLDMHSNTAPSTVNIDTGKPFLFKLLVHGDYGASSVQHVTLFTNLHDSARQVQDSDTVITWDKNSQPQLAITDPHGYFGQITVNTHADGPNLALDYNMTFAKPMPKSDIIFRIWGSDLYSADTYLLDAWDSVVGITQVTPSPLLKVQAVSNDTTTSKPLTVQHDVLETIKEWGGYSSKSISDSEMLHTFGLNGSHVPHWIMKNTKWAVDGTITPQDFGNALKYLSDSKIIK
ncbi:MAG: hypothetical protein KGL95_08230, partial [Patescibacteria group bacterium]|nr:hypothetical protein [Patescibacteria group bacterium]